MSICLRYLAMVLVLAAFAPAAAGAETKMTTHTYKQVGDLKIKADVYRNENGRVQPVVVWIHGGALIMGHREAIDARIKQAAIERNYVLVSLDYRLAPETMLPGIVSDIEDAFEWIRASGPKLFQADSERIAVVGGSAGGYLTLTAGFRVKPRPVALVSLWGYGELVGPWYSEPSRHPRHHQSKLSRDEAYKQVSGPPISDSRDRQGDGGAFYQFCRQQGSWPKAVSGWDPKAQESMFVPFMPLKNVTRDYPPTLLIHGQQDTDVPYEESVMMAEELKKNRVEYRLIGIPGGEHGLAGVDPQVVDQTNQQAIEFLQKHLEP